MCPLHFWKSYIRSALQSLKKHNLELVKNILYGSFFLVGIHVDLNCIAGFHSQKSLRNAS